MSEFTPHAPEQEHSPENLEARGPEKAAERQHHLEGHSEKHEHTPDEIAQIRESIMSAAKSRQETHVDAPVSPQHYLPVPNRKHALKSQLSELQRQESAVERGFSKAIHHPVVKTISDAGAKTVARPSGLLAGGFCAFLGSSIFLYIARHIGFSYNYLLFSLLFVGGFAIGLVLEAILALGGRLFKLRS